MSSEITYDQIRLTAQHLDSEFKDLGFCKGNGGCCKRDLEILDGDREVIKNAVASGEIPIDVVERAQMRAVDPEEDGCPFLGDDNRCTIYALRPAICMQYGNGGYPIDSEVGVPILLGQFNPEAQVPAAKLIKYVCDDCVVSLNPDQKLPCSLVQASWMTSNAIGAEILGSGATTMNDFVANEL